MTRTSTPRALTTPTASGTRTVPTALAAAFLGLAIAAAGVQAQQTGRYELRGQRVAIYNLAGVARVEPGSGSAVTVEVSRGGEDASSLRVETGPLHDAETLRVIYPGERVVYEGAGRGSRSQVRVREDGSFGDGGRRVTVAGSGRGTRAHADLTIRVPQGVEVAVYLGVGRAEARGVSADLLLDTHAAPVTARDIRGFLNVDTGSGSVEVAGVEGDLVVDTGSGRVEVSGVRGGRVNLDTGSGSVTGTDVRADELRVDTGSGRIRLSDVAATDLRLDTGSGGVEVDLTSDVRSLVIDTGSGGVLVRVPADLGGAIELETGSGGIQTDLPMQVTRASRDHLTGRLGDGDGTIRIDTGSGSIRLVAR